MKLNHVAVRLPRAALDEPGRSQILAFCGDVFGWREGDNTGERDDPLIMMTGTFGELFFPILLVLGIGGRIGALGLFAVNLMAVISYWHVLGTDEFIGGLRQHELWGFMLAMLAIYGSGALTLDRLLSRRAHLQPAWE